MATSANRSTQDSNKLQQTKPKPCSNQKCNKQPLWQAAGGTTLFDHGFVALKAKVIFSPRMGSRVERAETGVKIGIHRQAGYHDVGNHATATHGTRKPKGSRKQKRAGQTHQQQHQQQQQQQPPSPITYKLRRSRTRPAGAIQA